MTQEQMKRDIDALVARVQAVSGLTGGAVAMLRDGEVVLSHCFGYADVEQKTPITEETFFDIASCSKAFTAMTGAQAADAGVFDWDTPAVRYMPDYKMADEYITAHVTGRDMLSHRTGLPRHDFMRAKFVDDRADTVARIAYMDFSRGLREKYQYCNQMFIAFGYLLERITGKRWEDQVLSQIAQPLGMEMRMRGSDGGMVGLPYAKPYMTDGHRAVPTVLATGAAVAPCGGIKTNLRSLVKWVRALSNGGVYGDGKRLCSEAQMRELLTPNTTIGMDPADEREPLKTYSLGWQLTSYRGKACASHGGAINGFNSQVGFLPGTGCGYVVLVNTHGTPAYAVLRNYMLDLLTIGEAKDPQPLLDAWRKETDKTLCELAEIAALPAPTEEEISFLCGAYFHPTYDCFEIRRGADGAELTYGLYTVRLGRAADGVWRGVYGGDEFGHLELTRDGNDLRLRNPDSELKLQFVRQ